MGDLKVVDVDGLSIVVADDEGNNYRVDIDEASLRRLRHAQSATEGPKVSPKEIQFRLRAGLSAQEVSALTGATLEHIERYEGPVAAEKDYIISSAQTVPTQHHIELDNGETSSTFGSLISHRLIELAASAERWATWREETGNWVIKLEFTAQGIEHDARWTFDPKKRTLVPGNSDATTLSQRGELSTGLIPKLRAVHTDAIADTVIVETLREEIDLTEVAPEQSDSESSPTADLLEALRKRRSERDSAPIWLKDEVTEVIDNKPAHSDSNNMSGATLNIDDTVNFTEPFAEPENLSDSKQVGKKGRTSLPSWDDIVFGTRSDEDPS